MTKRIDTPASAETTNMITCNGSAPVSGVNIVPVTAASTAPPPIMIAPPNPLAVPASCGRTDSNPAVADGSIIPLPNPRKVQNPKKTSGWLTPVSDTTSDAPNPAEAMAVPIRAILFTPIRTAKRPDRKLPKA